MHLTILESVLLIFGVTLITTVICRSLKLSVIIGYLIVGSIIGPHALGLASSTEQIKLLAEFGVALLMFTVGLEFSLANLFTLKRSVFLVGGLQVVLSIATTVFIGWILNIGIVSAFIIGSIIAMSSTALVLKQLTDQLELNTEYGLHATGILLFQDLAVIPILVLIAALSTKSESDFLFAIFTSFSKGILVIFGMFLLGRWLLRPIFHLIAKTQQIELFTLTVLFIAVSAAWLTHQMGLSYALGAFIAGVMLSECEYKHQIKVEIRPFRDILLGLFFISIGMLVDVKTWPQTWPWILLIVIALTLGKSILIYGLTKLTKYNSKTALSSSLVLAQGGEFGFAILSTAISNHFMPNAWGQSVLAGLLICFLISPIIIRYQSAITHWIFAHHLLPDSDKKSLHITSIPPKNNHVILCGFGRVGKAIATFLEKIEQPYIAIEMNASLVKEAQRKGYSVLYGDATHPEILKMIHIKEAKAIVISFDHLAATKITLQQIHQLSENTPVIVRGQQESERDLLLKLGASAVITAMFEESMAFADHLLHVLAVPENEIDAMIDDARQTHYAKGSASASDRAA